MTWWQTLMVASVSGVIAPFFLWLQQRGQNARELAERQLQAAEKEREAERAAVERTTGERRAAYLHALRAVSQFRASVAPTMAKVTQRAADVSSSPLLTTAGLWGPGGPHLPTEKLGAALEALAEARLWAHTPEMLREIDMLQENLEAAAIGTTASSQTVREAADIWGRLSLSTEFFATAAHADLAR